MTSSLPAHLSEAISLRIAWLREVGLADAAFASAQPRLTSYPLAGGRPSGAGRSGVTTPTFPRPHSDDTRSMR